MRTRDTERGRERETETERDRDRWKGRGLKIGEVSEEMGVVEQGEDCRWLEKETNYWVRII